MKTIPFFASLAYGWMLGLHVTNIPAEIITAIIGVLSGGGASAIYALVNKNPDKKESLLAPAAEAAKDPITVLLVSLGLTIGVTIGIIAYNYWPIFGKTN